MSWGQAQFHAYSAHLVLKQFAQGLNQLEVHVFGQTANVMMRLDDVRLTGFGAGRFDDIRIDGSLGQPFHIFQAGGLCVEHIDKSITDNLALLLRVGNTFQAIEKQVLGIGPDNFHTHVTSKHVHDMVALIQA